MRLLQPFIPNYNYCIICGNQTESEACSRPCRSKLTLLRFTINERKGLEKIGEKFYDEHTIKAFNKIQDILKK